MENIDLGLTIKELKEICKDQIKMGNGDKHIIISNDDEGNGFHTLFYGFTTIESSSEENMKYILSQEHDETHSINNCVCLG